MSSAAKPKSGMTRRVTGEFVSPPLQSGENYTYDVQVNWKQHDREVTQKRRITIHAGEVMNLTFPETATSTVR